MLGLLYATAAVDDSSASGSAAAAPGDIKIHSRAMGYACVVAIYVFVRHRRLPSVPLGRPSVCSLAGCGTQTVCFAYSWGPCVWCLCSEIFPTAQRAKGVSITTTTNWTFGIVISLFVPVLQVREQTPPASPVPFNGANAVRRTPWGSGSSSSSRASAWSWRASPPRLCRRRGVSALTPSRSSGHGTCPAARATRSSSLCALEPAE